MASMSETEPPPERDPIDVLAEEFAHRCRRGEAPTVEEFAQRYPQHAEEIRRLLPTVAFLERGRLGQGGSSSRPGSSKTRLLADSKPPDPAPRQLGENRVVRELGRGGMGIVYEAVQEPLGRRVAVKVLPRHALGDAASRERFLREARVVARLQHPNIVPIHTVGEQDGVPYYVMPLIDGQGLDRLLDDAETAPPSDPKARARWVARLGRQAAEALAYAHGQGILHRDIKPANLLLDAAGTLWLADFGLAKLADDLSLTSTGELPGTLRYLAPECLHARADARSDIYSLGLTLYELLVGRPAFLEIDRVRLLRQIDLHQFPAPRQLVPELPRDLETIVLKALAYDPAARYATAAEFADDLGRFLGGHPIRARRTGRAERLVRWGRRNPLIATLAGTSIGLGLVAAVFLGLFLLAPAPPHPPRPHPGPGADVDAESPPSRGDEWGEPGFEGEPPPPRKGEWRGPGFEGRPGPWPPPHWGREGRRPPPPPRGFHPEGHFPPPPPPPPPHRGGRPDPYR